VLSSNLGIARFLRVMGKDNTGATAVEYGLILALIAAVIVAGLTLLGPAVSSAFTNIQGL
jgi:pilus assembly protein Flp/PilA